MWGWRSARAKSKAWEAARANAARAAEQQGWPPPAAAPTTPPAPALSDPAPSRPLLPPPRLQYDGPSTPAPEPLYGRWVDPPADAPVDTAIPVDEPDVDEPDVDEPDADDFEPATPLLSEALAAEAQRSSAPDPEPSAAPPEPPVEAPVATLRLVPSAESSSPSASVGPQPETQAEFLRLLEVVTSMCDHVIEYIEADRAERRMMIETLGKLSRTISETARAGIAAAPAMARVTPTESLEPRERVLGGSMPAGPERDIDLRDTEARPEPQLQPALADASARPTSTSTTTSTEIAVEVRGRFGDRWVDGFEICEVMSTPDGPRYRLRRQRDGVVLPELFDATSIRHIETFEQLNGDQLNGPPGYWSRS